MQLSELYRRSVLLPLEDSDVLGRDNITETEKFEVLEIDDNDNYFKHVVWPICKKINKLCGTHIDEYEEEEVGVCHNEKLLTIVNECIESDQIKEQVEFSKRLKLLVEKSIKTNKALLFIL